MIKARPDSGSAQADLAAASRVLELEAQAIHALSASLDASFVAAVEALLGVSGRVVVSGMGKSGHVARKIAATLASTGTPAQFVHPGEASHGDLGMIGRSDAVLALSFSGETEELADLIAYAARFKIPLIGMTGKANSTLAQAATVALLLPPFTEACPLGLAPTTSTTAMLALGDALAVALLERRGFTSADFQVLHPGGKLGKRLLRVSDLMHAGADLPLCKPGTPMSEALVEMTAKRLGCVVVVDEAGHALGIVTDGDLRRHMADDLPRQPAQALMTRNPRSIRPQALAAEAMALMNEGSPITSLLVIEDGRLAGILHIHDCLRAGVA
ncbi:MAG: KpsF/GutQ family sugar-phosphate isomerase [Alphaproteobacteria bacterium]|nr:KpsF/GutQ family sugar-phosphate isomerase [Alphaproteobacteria bacterium]